jgi:hypothetical protein
MQPMIHVLTHHAQFSKIVEHVFTSKGMQTSPLATTADALTCVENLSDGSPESVIVADLFIPRSSGKGYLGGLEVVRHAHLLDLPNRVFLFCRQPHEEAEQWSKQWRAGGIIHHNASAPDPVSYLEPLLSKLAFPKTHHKSLQSDEEISSSQIQDQTADNSMVAAAVASSEEEWDGEFHMVGDVGEGDSPESASTGDLREFQSLLLELSDPLYDDEINLIILRYASSFFARGALFFFNHADSVLSGFGAFGGGDHAMNDHIRKLSVSLETPSLFQECLQQRRPVQTNYVDTRWNQELVQALGAPAPRHVYTAPFFSPRGLEGIIYADNATTGQPISDTLLMEIFLQQAGAAIERSSLSRRVQEMLQTQPD